MYAGADFALMPSRYEPCGLVQMESMRFGTIPMVSPTGGLKDTVKDMVTGVVLDGELEPEAEVFPEDIERITQGIHRCVELYKTPEITQIRKNCMEYANTLTWASSAKQWEQLFTMMGAPDVTPHFGIDHEHDHAAEVV